MKKLHFGPGPNWVKPSDDWITVDIDEVRGDICIDFNKFSGFDLPDASVNAIYASHVFEHMNIYSAPKVFKECYRVLAPGGYIRIIIPHVRRSIEEYLKGNADFPLFKRRKAFFKKRFGHDDVSLFECLKGDFIGATGQPEILGEEGLAHQNAWDFDALVNDLCRAGFDKNNIKETSFQDSDCQYFSFEGTYPSEANETSRSLYVEAKK